MSDTKKMTREELKVLVRDLAEAIESSNPDTINLLTSTIGCCYVDEQPEPLPNPFAQFESLTRAVQILVEILNRYPGMTGQVGSRMRAAGLHQFVTEKAEQY